MITKDQYDEWVKLTKPPALRFGQWFCNHFNITDASLFYEESAYRSFRMIHEQYLTQLNKEV